MDEMILSDAALLLRPATFRQGTRWDGPKLYTGRVVKFLTLATQSVFIGMVFISIHTGARSNRQPSDKDTKEFIQQLLQIQRDKLNSGASALEVVEGIVCHLEDYPRFNCGTGSCLNAAGKVECDAAILDVQTGMFGAVAALEGVKNPIKVASALLKSQRAGRRNERGLYRPVFLAGEGALQFAMEHQIELSSSLATEERKNSYTNLRLDTVGVIAIDNHNQMVLATSSGGRWLKEVGRVGSSPVFGAGFWSGHRQSLKASLCLTGVGEVILSMALAAKIGNAILNTHPDDRSECLCSCLEEVGDSAEIGVMMLIQDGDQRGEFWVATAFCGLPYGFIQGQGESFYTDFARGHGSIRLACHSIKW